MKPSPSAPTAVDPPSPRSLPSAARDLIRIAAPVGYTAALVAHLAVRGIPFDREQVLLWVVIGLFAVSVAAGTPRRAPGAVRDWVPLAVLLLLYDWSRGLADGLGMPIQTEFPAAFDRIIFPGGLPTAELQQRLLSYEVAWWEPAVALVYVSHFVVPYVILGVAWVRDRALWSALILRFLILTAMALATYVLLPTAPPWLLSEQGNLERLTRSAGRGWSRWNLDIAADLIDKGQSSVNLVAAIPSLHAAYPMLFLLALWPRFGMTARVAFALYTLAMGFVLVLSAEHFVFDVVLGWLYAAAAGAIGAAVERRRDRRVVA